VESEVNDESISEVANWCLAIAERRDIETETRVAAVCRIAELGERGTVPRLLRMLPGDYDVITFEVINALGSLKDPRASPVLDRMLSSSKRIGVEVPGKIRAAAREALSECTHTRKRKD
jgi:HEAT repeat protein